MLYFHAVRGADPGTKINNPRGAVRQNIPKPHRVCAVRGAVDISSVDTQRREKNFVGKHFPISLCPFFPTTRVAPKSFSFNELYIKKRLVVVLKKVAKNLIMSLETSQKW